MTVDELVRELKRQQDVGNGDQRVHVALSPFGGQHPALRVQSYCDADADDSWLVIVA